LILRKIIKIVTTRCHILRLKGTKFDFGCWGSLQRSPDPLAGLRGPTSKGREGRGGKGRGREGGEKGGKGKREREGKGKREREGGSLYNWKPPPPGRNPGYATVRNRFTVGAYTRVHKS